MTLNSLFPTETVTIDPEKENLILKVNMNLRSEVLDAIYFDVLKQYEKGVVVIPSYIDFAIVPKETEILVEKEKQNA